MLCRMTALILTALLPPLPACSSEPDWTARKCALYASAFADALAANGTDGLRPAFLEANEAFIAGDCQTLPVFCAKGRSEVDLLNLLTVMTMNEGMASTFVPFTCTSD